MQRTQVCFIHCLVLLTLLSSHSHPNVGFVETILVVEQQRNVLDHLDTEGVLEVDVIEVELRHLEGVFLGVGHEFGLDVLVSLDQVFLPGWVSTLELVQGTLELEQPLVSLHLVVRLQSSLLLPVLVTPVSSVDAHYFVNHHFPPAYGYVVEQQSLHGHVGHHL